VDQRQLVSQALRITQEKAELAEAYAVEGRATNASLKIQLEAQRDRAAGGYKFRSKGNKATFLYNLELLAMQTQVLTSFE
jgi:hypothetical protein